MKFKTRLDSKSYCIVNFPKFDHCTVVIQWDILVLRRYIQIFTVKCNRAGFSKIIGVCVCKDGRDGVKRREQRVL